MQKRLKLGELLVHAGALEPLQLRAALLDQQKLGGRLGAILVSKGYVTEKMLIGVLSKQLGYPAVDLDSANVPRDVLAKIDPEFSKRNMVIPLGMKGPKVLLVAMSDPTNLPLIGELEFRTNCRIEPVLAGDTAINRTISRLYYGVEMRALSTPAEDQSDLKMLDSGGQTVMVVSPEGARAPTSDMPTVQLPPGQAVKPEVYFGTPEPARDGTPSVIRNVFGQQEGAARADAALPPDATKRIEKIEESLRKVEATHGKLLKIVKEISSLLVEKGIITRGEFKDRIGKE